MVNDILLDLHEDRVEALSLLHLLAVHAVDLRP